MTNESKIYDLEERTAKFGEDVIRFVKKIPRSDTNQILIIQLVKSSTSVGGNYCEADCAESRKDFEHKIGICKKEAKESKHWLRMINVNNPDVTPEADDLIREAHELCLIFISIIKKSKIST